MTDSNQRTPLGITLLCLLLAAYGFLWLVAWFGFGAAGDGGIALLSLTVGSGVLLVAYFLHAGSRIAWGVALFSLGGSTLWRLSLVAGGATGNLSNVVVGTILVAYLLYRRSYFRPAGPSSPDRTGVRTDRPEDT